MAHCLRMQRIAFLVLSAIALALGIVAAISLIMIVYTIFQGTGLLPVYFFGLLFSAVSCMGFASMAEGISEY